MNKGQKHILAVHDISGVGKCSLTVALPILSAAGHTVSVLPTAVLSTHTGGFEGYTFRDLTGDIAPMMDHWQALGLSFDALYTGYLGSYAQLELMENLFDRFGEGALIAVDPVMADNGALYATFDRDFPAGMRRLCARAGLITPNMTEAALLLGEEYCPPPYDRAYIEDMLQKLHRLGPGLCVITGAVLRDGATGAALYDGQQFVFARSPQVPGVFHGTGDVFASALLGALLADVPAGQAVHIAVDYLHACTRETLAQGTDLRYGVCFEKELPGYIQALARAAII